MPHRIVVLPLQIARPVRFIEVLFMVLKGSHKKALYFLLEGNPTKQKNALGQPNVESIGKKNITSCVLSAITK